MLGACALAAVLAAGVPGDPTATDTTARVDSTAAPAATMASPVAADTSVRIPGTPIRFGWSPARAAHLGLAAGRGGTRAGAVPWFGVPATVTLRFQGGALAGGEIAVKDASARDLDYIEDQLARAGFRRWCRGTPDDRTCTWMSHTQTIETHLAAGVLQATVVRTEMPLPEAVAMPPRPSQAPAPPARTADLAPSTTAPAVPVPMLPETLSVAHAATDAVHQAHVLHSVAPHYPASARRNGIQGRIWVVALVDTTGRVMAAHAQPPLVRGLDPASATDAVRQWTFVPLSVDGHAVRFRVRIPIVYTLH